MQKLYLATEKLKRTERRIKRANKRSEIAYNELAAKRQQINEIKRRIDAQNQEMSDMSKQIEADSPKYMPLVQTSDVDNSVSEEAVYVPPQTEEDIPAPVTHVNEKLTFENNNATNLVEEKKEQSFLTKESAIMAKDTENKKVQETQEFKPPYVDDTAMDSQPESTSDIRFARKTNILLDDKYKKVWMYSVSILVSLIVVFGIFYFISGDSSPNENTYTTNYIEQQNYFAEESQPQYEEPTPVVEEEVIAEEPEELPPPVEEKPIVEEKKVVPPAPVAKSVKKIEPAKKKAPVKPAPVKKETKPAPVKSVPVAKHVQPTPVVEEEVIVEEDFDNEEYYEDDTSDDEDVVVEEDDEDEDEEEDESNDEDEDENENENEELSSLDEARDAFVENVIDNDAYITLIDKISANYFENNTDIVSLLEQLNDMNGYWNTFRNLSYDEYYSSDYSLKADIDYEAYTEDEYLLRLYTNKYFEMYEHLVNEFVMTYEYANGTASNLYPAMEKELQILGKPNAKLQLLIELYNAIQRAGGVNAVLEGIAIKDENERLYAPEIEAVFIPLESTTTVIVNDEIIYNDGSEAISSYSMEEEDDDLLVENGNELSDDEEYADASSDEDDEDEVADSDDEVETYKIASVGTIQTDLSIAENIENQIAMDDEDTDDEEEYADSDDEEDDENEDELADSDEDDEEDDEEEEIDVEYTELEEEYYEES